MHHNDCACALETRDLQLLKPTCLEPMFCNKKNYRNEKPVRRNWRVAPSFRN